MFTTIKNFLARFLPNGARAFHKIPTKQSEILENITSSLTTLKNAVAMQANIINHIFDGLSTTTTKMNDIATKMNDTATKIVAIEKNLAAQNTTITRQKAQLTRLMEISGGGVYPIKKMIQ